MLGGCMICTATCGNRRIYSYLTLGARRPGFSRLRSISEYGRAGRAARGARVGHDTRVPQAAKGHLNHRPTQREPKPGWGGWCGHGFSLAGVGEQARVWPTFFFCLEASANFVGQWPARIIQRAPSKKPAYASTGSWVWPAGGDACSRGIPMSERCACAR